jgi:hypothetical protein
MATKHAKPVQCRKTTQSSNRKRAAAAGKAHMVLPGRRRKSGRPTEDFDRDLHGAPGAQVANTRSIEMRTVPATGIAKERKGKK